MHRLAHSEVRSWLKEPADRGPPWRYPQVTEVPPFSAEANAVLEDLATSFSVEDALQVCACVCVPRLVRGRGEWGMR